ncbi:hypothetical protein [Streptomyces sp. c-19]|uniref:hypothetical protein n=1 Tax=Streptomyces sp. c-19 TaxID=2789275 RepID=UPI003980310E
MVDIEFAGVVDLDAVVVAAPFPAAQLAAGGDGGRFDGFGQEDFGAGVTTVPEVETRVPVLELVAGVAGAGLVGDADLVERGGELEDFVGVRGRRCDEGGEPGKARPGRAACS